MARRDYGSGTVRPRPGGGFAAELRVGRGPDGKWRRVYATGPTEAAALAAVRRKRREYEAGKLPPADRQTVAQFLAHWLADVVPGLAPASAAGYRSVVHAHALPAFGHVRLQALTPRHLQELYGRLLRQGLSPNTVRKIHVVLAVAFGYAVDADLLPRNPVSRARPPKPVRRLRDTLSAAQAVRLLQAAAADRLAAYWWLALDTGLRPGELCALRWRDLDLSAATLTVPASKTSAGRRVVPLSPEAVARLHGHWEQQRGLGDGHVFLTAFGAPYVRLNSIRRAWYALCDRAGVPRILLYGLRHTWATLHRQLGTSLQTVSEMAGHTSIAITADVYTRSSPGQQREAAGALGRLLGGGLPIGLPSSGQEPNAGANGASS